MNTSAYLAYHGWKGEGHALQPSGRGLKKPLLTSQKQNVFGLGKTRGSALTNQWWLNSFNKSLKEFDLQDKKAITESLATQAEAKSREDATEGVLNKYFDKAGFYARFVTGVGLKGTLGITGFESTASVKELVEKVATVSTDASGLPETRTVKHKRKVKREEVTASIDDSKCKLPILNTEDEMPKNKKRKRQRATDSSTGEEAMLPITLARKSVEEKTRPAEQSLLEVTDSSSKQKSANLGKVDILLKSTAKCTQRRESQKAEAGTIRPVQHVDTFSPEVDNGRSKQKLKEKKIRRREFATQS